MQGGVHDYQVFNDSVSYLRLGLKDYEILVPHSLPWDYIHGLKELIVEKESWQPQMALRGWSISAFVIDFNTTKSPHPLALLESLEIPIPLRKIDATLFKDMGRLKYLNLSHTFGLTASDISQVLQNLSYAGNTLEQLDLSWCRSFPDMQWDVLNIREDILKHLAKFPLKLLDLRGIELVEFDMGFAEFTPGLQKLYIGEYPTPVRNREIENCIWLDISILPNITEILIWVSEKITMSGILHHGLQ